MTKLRIPRHKPRDRKKTSVRTISSDFPATVLELCWHEDEVSKSSGEITPCRATSGHLHVNSRRETLDRDTRGPCTHLQIEVMAARQDVDDIIPARRRV